MCVGAAAFPGPKLLLRHEQIFDAPELTARLAAFALPFVGEERAAVQLPTLRPAAADELGTRQRENKYQHRFTREGYEAAARYEQRSEWAEVFTHDDLAYVNAVLDDETLAAFKFARVASLSARQQGEVERQRRENEANVRSVGQSYAERARARLDYKQGRGEGVEGALPMRSLSPLELMLHLSTKRSF